MKKTSLSIAFLLMVSICFSINITTNAGANKKPIKLLTFNLNTSKKVEKKVAIPSDKLVADKVNDELAAAKASGIAIKSAVDARKDKKYIYKYDFGPDGDNDKYRSKYVGQVKRSSHVPLIADYITGITGKVDFETNKFADSFIRACFNNKNGGQFVSADGASRYACLPGTISNKAPFLTLNKDAQTTILSGKALTYVLSIIEVGYDSTKRLYYVRSIEDKEYPNGKITKISTTSNIPIKYIALTRLVAKPIPISAEEQAVRGAGIVEQPIVDAKNQGHYVGKTNFGYDDIRDPYINKYLGVGNVKGVCYYGIDGTRGFNDWMIRGMFALGETGRITSSNGNESYYCVPENYLDDGTKFVAGENDYKPGDGVYELIKKYNDNINAGKELTYVLMVAEIGYDNVLKQYYVRSVATKEFLKGKMSIDMHTKDKPEKYIAWTRLIVEPISK